MTAERLAEYKARFRAAIDQMDKTEQFAAEAACPSLSFLREMDEDQLDAWAQEHGLGLHRAARAACEAYGREQLGDGGE